MTMRVQPQVNVKGEAGADLVAGTIYTVSDAFGAALVGSGRALDVDGVLNPRTGAAVRLEADLVVGSHHDGILFESTAAVTVTIPQGLSPKPAVVLIPKGGTITVAVTGAATINGAATSLTRTLANNPAGFVVQPYRDANGYGVSGS